ncbi:NMD pathway component [Castilleja foliolosa]|uniref:NMD pathway component n=1 Tax=Castilleja foliolosa TaxID=1961234 RepID=A0ABD3DBC8_9LAMI
MLLKHLTHSRAYIDFSRPDDVIEFAEFFNGHVFVNEKGTQFKAIVEYAPSQRVPKQLAKKDGREGTVLKDPEYLRFLEFLAKPVENLPSAGIQLERREAERSGAPKDVPVVTPLMEYVRQKRVAQFGPPNLVEWEVIKKSWWNFIEDSCLRFLKKRLRKEKDFDDHEVLSMEEPYSSEDFDGVPESFLEVM